MGRHVLYCLLRQTPLSPLLNVNLSSLSLRLSLSPVNQVSPSLPLSLLLSLFNSSSLPLTLLSLPLHLSLSVCVCGRGGHACARVDIIAGEFLQVVQTKLSGSPAEPRGNPLVFNTAHCSVGTRFAQEDGRWMADKHTRQKREGKKTERER